FERIRALQGQGVTFLFISHHLQEIYEICDTVTVLRDATHVLTAPVAEVSRQRLVTAMTGEQPAAAAEAARGAPDADAPTGLTVTGLRATAGAPEVSFTVRAGEVVGLAGGGGSGKVEVAESIVGLRRPAAGDVAVDGRAVRPGSVPAALAAGVGLVPQDRHRE